MNNLKYNPHPNPIVSFVIKREEMKKLQEFAERHACSIAQVARGAMRVGIEDSARSSFDYVKEGKRK